MRLEYSPQVQPPILTPGHGTLPMGHAIEAFIVAYVLIELLKGLADSANAKALKLLREELMRQAARIAINRIVAGVHFPVDAVAGEMLGLKLGEYFVDRCKGWSSSGYAPATTTLTPYRFAGPRYVATDDFDFRTLYSTDDGTFQAPPFLDLLSSASVTSSPLLAWLWQKAAAEWT